MNYLTQLSRACAYGDLKQCVALVDGGVSVNQMDAIGDTPLHDAARCGQEKIARFLLSKGSLVNIVNLIGNTPLRDAAYYGHFGIVSALIDAGADVNKPNPDSGLTALHEAVRRNHVSIVRTLLHEGADVYQTDGEGNTPLHLAVQHGTTSILLAAAGKADDVSEESFLAKELSIMRLLLDSGSNVLAQNQDGLSVLALAENTESHHRDLVMTHLKQVQSNYRERLLAFAWINENPEHSGIEYRSGIVALDLLCIVFQYVGCFWR